MGNYTAQGEGSAINSVFRSLSINAAVTDLYGLPTSYNYVVTGFRANPNSPVGFSLNINAVSPKKITSALNDIRRTIHHYRMQTGGVPTDSDEFRSGRYQTRVDFDEESFVLSVNRPHPKPMVMPAVTSNPTPFSAQIGMQWVPIISRGKAEVIKNSISVSLVGSHVTNGHLLAVGASGSGKTTLMQTMLIGMCENTSPDMLQVEVYDPRETQLGFFGSGACKLPHVRSHSDVSSIVEILKYARSLIDKRQSVSPEYADDPNHNPGWKRILIVIDEFAVLMDSGLGRSVLSDISHISKEGRKFGVHLLFGAQNVSAKTAGDVLKSFVDRIVGQVASAQDAVYASGVQKSGAENLTGKGHFILKVGSVTSKFNAYLVPDLERKCAFIRAKWGYVEKGAEKRVSAASDQDIEITMEDEVEHDESFEVPSGDYDDTPQVDPSGIPVPLADVFAEYHQFGLRMRHGWLKRACDAFYGKNGSKPSHYAAKAEMNEALSMWLRVHAGIDTAIDRESGELSVLAGERMVLA